MKPTLYALFLSATLGADDFNTRRAWHRRLEGVPLLCVPGCYHDDAEVRHRCRRIVGYNPPAWTDNADTWAAIPYLLLASEAQLNEFIVGDAATDGWGTVGTERVVWLENAAKAAGLLTNGHVLNYYPGTWESVEAMRRRVHGLPALVPAPRPVLPIPVPLPLP